MASSGAEAAGCRPTSLLRPLPTTELALHTADSTLPLLPPAAGSREGEEAPAPPLHSPRIRGPVLAAGGEPREERGVSASSCNFGERGGASGKE